MLKFTIINHKKNYRNLNKRILKMKSLRFYFALNFAKFTSWFMKKVGKRGTIFPGYLAIHICPDFLGQFERPKTVIGITGTNGKTTVTNMIVDALESLGKEVLCNKAGTNVDTGIATVLLNNSNCFGKYKQEIAVFEIDERGTPRTLKYLMPDLMLVTNLFRDSTKRNAHPEYIFDLLEEQIPKSTKLILNADDPLSSSLAKGHDAKFFGIKPQDFEEERTDNIVVDGNLCPVCSTKLSYDFIRYHHIGVAHCEHCGHTFPERDYLIEKVDLETMHAKINVDGKIGNFKLIHNNPIHMYNQLSAISVLNYLGYDNAKIGKVFEELNITEARHTSVKYGDKTLSTFLAKGMNPVACSRTFDLIKNLPGKKCIIMLIYYYPLPPGCVENISWLYDTDFEHLNDPNINQIIVEGEREADFYLRMKMAGIDPSIIKHFSCREDVVDMVDYEMSDHFVFLYDLKIETWRKRIHQGLIEKLGGKVDEN